MSGDELRLGGRSLVVRADATTEGGTGHLMRSLALAQAWLDAGGRVHWIVADAPGSLLARIESEGIEIARSPAEAGSGEDARMVREALLRDPGAVAAIDGTAFDGRYLEALDDVQARVLLIDDTGGRPNYPVGLLLNQNAHAERGAYPAGSSTRFLLGTTFVLLRREFVAPPPRRSTPAVARHLLVTFGGADPTGMTLRTIAALGRLPDRLRAAIEVRCLVGAANADGPAIDDAAAMAARLGLHVLVERAVVDMPARMSWADLAVTSGGSTVWELARAGCPALIVETVPVERRLVAGLAKVGLFGHLGPGAGLDERHLADEIAAKAEDVAWRAAMTRLGMEMIDGRGARRVVEALADAGRARKEPT